MDPTKAHRTGSERIYYYAEDRIIANPNCSTIQMVVALAPPAQSIWYQRLVISTYQSVTGTGEKP